MNVFFAIDDVNSSSECIHRKFYNDKLEQDNGKNILSIIAVVGDTTTDKM